MRGGVGLAILCGSLFAASAAGAYDTLKQDYAACTQGSGKLASEDVVDACTRLIDNSAKENELVGFFHAMRAANNDDPQLNCADAHKVLELTNEPTIVAGANKIIDMDCKR